MGNNLGTQDPAGGGAPAAGDVQQILAAIQADLAQLRAENANLLKERNDARAQIGRYQQMVGGGGGRENLLGSGYVGEREPNRGSSRDNAEPEDLIDLLERDPNRFVAHLGTRLRKEMGEGYLSREEAGNILQSTLLNQRDYLAWYLADEKRRNQAYHDIVVGRANQIYQTQPGLRYAEALKQSEESVGKELQFVAAPPAPLSAPAAGAPSPPSPPAPIPPAVPTAGGAGVVPEGGGTPPGSVGRGKTAPPSDAEQVDEYVAAMDKLRNKGLGESEE